jgi:hypothetical protein
MDSLVVKASFGEIRFYSDPLPTQSQLPPRITQCSEDDCLIIDAEMPGSAYYCHEFEKAESEVRQAKLRYKGNVMELETKDLFNLDSMHDNFQGAQILVHRSRSFLVAKLGPTGCIHYAAWRLSSGRKRLCGQFGSPIAYDIYSDQKQLTEKVWDLCK